MTLRLVVDEIRKALSATVAQMYGATVEFDVSEPPRKEFGDLTSNVAFQLSKRLKMPPSKIASEIVEHLIKTYISQNSPSFSPFAASTSFILSAEPHPAGYINFKTNYARLSSATLKQILASPATYGHYDSGKGRRIVIEHTSVNPNKALHVGHMRNVILGDALYRIMKATNHDTIVLNYIDDSGLQVADIVVGFKFAGFPVEPSGGKKFDQYCGDEVYVKVNEMYGQDPVLAEKRKLVLKEIEEGKSEIARFASEITLKVLKEQLKTCWRIKARYDLLNFESHIVRSKLWKRTFELLKENGIVRFETEGKNKGCWVIGTAGGEEDKMATVTIEGEDSKVLVRSDGTATYIAKDIPYAAWKLGLVEDPFFYQEFVRQWDGSILYTTALDNDSSSSSNRAIGKKRFNGGQRVITIIDSRQARLQRIISYVLSHIAVAGRREKKEGKEEQEERSPKVTTTGAETTDKRQQEQQWQQHQYYHLGYEAVTLSSDTAKALGIDIGEREFMHMSGRRGIYVNADYVLDMLHAKAYEEVKKRNPEFTEQQLNDVAEDIAVSAIRYNMIKQDLDKIITFDIKESLSLEGDTGPYLQYAYARSQRILEKSGQAVAGSDFKFEMLTHESELELIKEMSKLDLVVEDAAGSLGAKSLARYAYLLATSFNLFYERVPVLKEKNSDVRMARLALVKAFGIVLKNTLDMLGIAALERM